MTDLDKALGDISSIRREMARSTQFRGYGPATLAATGVFAIAAASAQAALVPDPIAHIRRYFSIWLATAVVSIALTGTQMYTRTRRIHSGLSNEMLRLAVEQFLPALAAGVLLTWMLLYHGPTGSPSVFWMLPGLWQIIYGLGVFSSCRFLPRPMLLAGAWFMVSGMAVVSLGGTRTLEPWTMGVGFGVGQLLMAGILLLATPEDADAD